MASITAPFSAGPTGPNVPRKWDRISPLLSGRTLLKVRDAVPWLLYLAKINNRKFGSISQLRPGDRYVVYKITFRGAPDVVLYCRSYMDVMEQLTLQGYVATPPLLLLKPDRDRAWARHVSATSQMRAEEFGGKITTPLVLKREDHDWGYVKEFTMTIEPGVSTLPLRSYKSVIPFVTSDPDIYHVKYGGAVARSTHTVGDHSHDIVHSGEYYYRKMACSLGVPPVPASYLTVPQYVDLTIYMRTAGHYSSLSEYVQTTVAYEDVPEANGVIIKLGPPLNHSVYASRVTMYLKGTVNFLASLFPVITPLSGVTTTSIWLASPVLQLISHPTGPMLPLSLYGDRTKVALQMTTILRPTYDALISNFDFPPAGACLRGRVVTFCSPETPSQHNQDSSGRYSVDQEIDFVCDPLAISVPELEAMRTYILPSDGFGNREIKLADLFNRVYFVINVNGFVVVLERVAPAELHEKYYDVESVVAERVTPLTPALRSLASSEHFHPNMTQSSSGEWCFDLTNAMHYPCLLPVSRSRYSTYSDPTSMIGSIYGSPYDIVYPPEVRQFVRCSCGTTLGHINDHYGHVSTISSYGETHFTFESALRTTVPGATLLSAVLTYSIRHRLERMSTVALRTALSLHSVNIYERSRPLPLRPQEEGPP